jgi:hypothetical protein
MVTGKRGKVSGLFQAQLDKVSVQVAFYLRAGSTTCNQVLDKVGDGGGEILELGELGRVHFRSPGGSTAGRRAEALFELALGVDFDPAGSTKCSRRNLARKVAVGYRRSILHVRGQEGAFKRNCEGRLVTPETQG